MVESFHPPKKCGVIIVSYQSEEPLKKALWHLKQQTRPADQIVIVDSGSPNGFQIPKKELPEQAVVISLYKNVGFSAANNIGWRYLKEKGGCDYLLFLNPDAFLAPDFLAKAIDWMEQPEQQSVGAMTGTLLGYDLQRNSPTGLYDSRGIYQRWYGNWYDRDQGQACRSTEDSAAIDVPAICGALMLCRAEALQSVMMGSYGIFDESFFMYKEDIDLSLRLRKRGWRLLLLPQLIAYHCRGWQKNRQKVPKQLRLCSASNELRLHLRHKKPLPIFYSLSKWCAVQLFNL